MPPEDLPEDEIREEPVLTPESEEVPEVLPGAVVKQENDPVMKKIISTRKSVAKLKKLLRAEKRRGTPSIEKELTPEQLTSPDDTEHKKPDHPIDSLWRSLGTRRRKDGQSTGS